MSNADLVTDELIISGIYKRGTNICFDCEKAIGGCCWSEVDPNTKKVRFEPVPGWKTKRVCKKFNRKWKIVEQIVECPLFEKTPDRRG